MAAPIILTQVFVYFAKPPFHFPGAGFLAASAFLVVAMGVFMRLRAQPAAAAPEPAE